MRIRSRLLLAVALALGLIPTASNGQSIVRVAGDNRSLPPPALFFGLSGGGNYRAMAESGRLPIANRLENSGGAQVLDLSTSGLGRTVNSLGSAVSNQAFNSMVSFRDAYRGLTIPPLGDFKSIAAVGSDRLHSLATLTRDIRSENVRPFSRKEILPEQFHAGIALPNNWVFKVLGLNRYLFFDRNTNQGFVIAGDPHVLKYGSEEHYADWTAKMMVFVLPSVSPRERVIVVARSDGGSGQRDAYGLPTDLYVLTDRATMHVEGLGGNPASPPKLRGSHAENPVFVFRALKREILTAPVLFWDGKTNELRTLKGERTAPPPQAREYGGRTTPTVALDPDATLQNGDFRFEVEETPGLTRPELEHREQFRQAVAAKTDEAPEVRAAGKAYVELSQRAALAVEEYVDRRAKIVDRLERINKELLKHAENVNAPGVPLREVEIAKQVVADLIKEGNELKTKLKALDAAPSPEVRASK